MQSWGHCRYTGKYRSAARSLCNLRYSIFKEIPVVFLQIEFEREFNCLGENNAKYKTFLLPITEEFKRIDKYKEELQKPYLKN